MRAVLLIALLAFAMAVPPAGRVAADTGLTASVAATWFARYTTNDLHAIAHERVMESAACDCLDHAAMRPGTAEVLAFNTGYPDPIATAVSRWRASSGHNSILSNTSYGNIGCAEAVVDGTHWFACVLSSGPLPPAPAPAPAAPLLPNTALPGA